MTASRPAAGGGRWVDVAPERLGRWLAGFAERHGPTTGDGSTWTAADGAVARCVAPLAPQLPGLDPGAARVGVLLVRLGGFAAGVFEGSRLVSSKVGSRQVHGRIAAGGQSQQRFSRRRDNQVVAAYAAAADNAVRVLLPELLRLDAVVTGGERTAVEAVLADRRLAGLLPRVVDRLVDVPDPRLAVLVASPAQWRAVRVHVTEPATGPVSAPSAGVGA